MDWSESRRRDRGRRLVLAFLVTGLFAGCGSSRALEQDHGPAAPSYGSNVAPEPSRSPTSIIAPTPGVISDLQCDDTASCISGFRLDGRIFQVLCYPIRDDAVADQELGSGVLFGDHVTLAAITGVEPSTLAALSPSNALCTSNTNSPTGSNTTWTAVSPADAGGGSALADALCTVAVLTPDDQLAAGCYNARIDLVRCTTGPPFPPEFLDDLDAAPPPPFEVSTILPNASDDDLIGWHYIVEERRMGYPSGLLLLRHNPATGELEYLLGDTTSPLAGPTPCDPVSQSGT